MKRNLVKQHYLMLCVAVSLVGCDSSGAGRPGQSSSEKSAQSEAQSQKITEALKASGAMLPEGAYKIDENKAHSDEQDARRLQGDRGVFNDMHEKQGITLMPAKTSLALNASQAEQQIDAVVVDGAQCNAEQAKKVCASACATATANAYAFAFAHASATACAWAQAWACAFTFRPFTQVCSWASSQACATAFSSAFGAAFSTDTQTVCNTQCAQ